MGQSNNFDDLRGFFTVGKTDLKQRLPAPSSLDFEDFCDFLQIVVFEIFVALLEWKKSKWDILISKIFLIWAFSGLFLKFIFNVFFVGC